MDCIRSRLARATQMLKSKELYAVCAHLGGSMERGHYVAFVNLGPTLDEEVRPQKVGGIAMSKAYNFEHQLNNMQLLAS